MQARQSGSLRQSSADTTAPMALMSNMTTIPSLRKTHVFFTEFISMFGDNDYQKIVCVTTRVRIPSEDDATKDVSKIKIYHMITLGSDDTTDFDS